LLRALAATCWGDHTRHDRCRHRGDVVEVSARDISGSKVEERRGPRGRKRRDPQAAQIARLEQEKRQLEQELAKTRFVVDVQAKLHALLETLSESADTEPRSTP
jgi:hypothetical protein